MIKLLRRISVKKNICVLVLTLAVALFIFSTTAFAEKFENIPAKGTVTMIDLGAKSCIPCKMMTPILEKLEKSYKGRADIIFIDVRENQSQGERFRIQFIPTQIFFDKTGQEVYRHVGFMNESDIVAQLKKIGVH